MGDIITTFVYIPISC